jgi:hypothetical protein
VNNTLSPSIIIDSFGVDDDGIVETLDQQARSAMSQAQAVQILRTSKSTWRVL